MNNTLKIFPLLPILAVVALLGYSFLWSISPDLSYHINTNLTKAKKTFSSFHSDLKSSSHTGEKITFDYPYLRRSWQETFWLIPLIDPDCPVSKYDNSQHWVRLDEYYQRQYPEAASLQIIERELTQDSSNYALLLEESGKLIDLLTSLITKTRHTEPSRAELRSALAVDIYEHYLLSLSGYYQISQKGLWRNYHEAVQYQHSWALQLIRNKRTNRKLNKLFRELSKYLSATTFDTVDRIKLYKRYLRPIIQILLADLSPAELPSRYDHIDLIGSDPFSESFWKKEEIDDSTTQMARIALGRLLFYEPMLSGNQKRTCASCHKPQKAFSDGRSQSLGFDFTQKLDRNAPSLVNIGLQKHFGHGMEHPSMISQIQAVFDHPQEFRSDISEVIKRLNTVKEYQTRFQVSFPKSNTIDSNQILTALASYVASLNDFDSPFDRFMRDEINELDIEIKAGYNLFMGKAMCGSCHFAPLFSGLKPMLLEQQEYQSHGITDEMINPDEAIADLGIGSTKQDPRYNYFFKTPSLRNLAHTLPYMHNGVFNSLEETLSYISTPTNRLSLKEQKEIQRFLESLSGNITNRESEKISLPPSDGSLGKVYRRASGVF